ncbi:MAG: hypothetical protein K6G30_13345 [Acetatifactor sp.]|nr:hypothetical protein [Acetatifactor sp.]
MEEILRKEFFYDIASADKILIGIGEEFDTVLSAEGKKEAGCCKQFLKEKSRLDLLPAIEMLCRDKEDTKIIDGLAKLVKLIEDKDYYVVSTSTNSYIDSIKWKENRLVTPCGGSTYKQCPDCCEGSLTKLEDDDWAEIKKIKNHSTITEQLGICKVCGQKLILNNIYAKKYDESSYLKDWQQYMTWLQRTINRKLMILELGVGLQYPSVIRWPFEKVAFYNQKASFYRVNEKLYQLTPELHDKGKTIAQNSIDWLASL